MNKKLLTAALLGSLAFAQAASAQEFDDRWYLTGSAGFNLQDNDRTTNDAPFLTLGLGKFVSPNWSIDGELNYQNPNFDANQDLNWPQYGISFDLRRHFISEGRGWNPYLLFGLGYQRSEESYEINSIDSPAKRKDGNLAAKVGAGLQTTLAKRVGVRAEVAYRGDFDDQSVAAPNESWFGDVLASVGVVVPLGPAPVAATVAPPPPPPAKDFRCPDGSKPWSSEAQPGMVLDQNGCPQKITIDLKGVNFDFDKATLRPDALEILGQVVQILQRYPDLRVEVAGHTDLCGPEAYNQKLSERRATTVYNYLTKNGISSSRLDGPIGYGESRPLVPTPQTLPGCKNETNRRTELNVQN